MRALIREVCPDFIVYSSVLASALYKLRVITSYVANKYIVWVVDHKSLVRMGLPPIANKISRCSYAEDNKLDTQ